MAMVKDQLMAQQAVTTKNYQAIDLVMSLEQIEETDDTTIQTQWSIFETIQSQQFASMRQQLEQCHLANGTGLPPSPIIETSSVIQARANDEKDQYVMD